MKLTIYYDGQFWVGVVEEIINSKLTAARYIFGPEPHDSDILWLVNHRLRDLLAFSKPRTCNARPIIKSTNPKRLARQVAKEIHAKGISTYSQKVLKENLKSHAAEKHIQSKLQRDKLAEKKRKMAVLKAKAKHRGR